MKSQEMAKIVSEFIDEKYPKGNLDRGFAICVLTLFLTQLEENGYHITNRGSKS
jgi:hypothetical protein